MFWALFRYRKLGVRTIESAWIRVKRSSQASRLRGYLVILTSLDAYSLGNLSMVAFQTSTFVERECKILLVEFLTHRRKREDHCSTPFPGYVPRYVSQNFLTVLFNFLLVFAFGL